MKFYKLNKLSRRMSVFIFTMVAALFSISANADLTTDMQSLVTDANNLKNVLSATQITANNICGPLKNAKAASSSHMSNIAVVDSSLTSPLIVNGDIFTAFENLTNIYVGLGTESIRLSTDLNALSATVDQLGIAEGITLVLALSDDIGAMADRIGEMADRILVMSDNIGLMADRIITTQQIQNANLQLTYSNILTAQTNVIGLVSQIDTSVFNTDLLNQLNLATLLDTDMKSVVLTAINSATELARLEASVADLKNQVLATNATIDTNAFLSTMTINQQSLTTLLDLNGKIAALATAVKGYSIAIDGLNATSATPTLSDSAGSILRLSYDIGVMANRIGEESDLILEMADNIGLQADQIVTTQQLQSVNVATTEAALLSAQTTIINLIVKYGL